MFFEGAINLTMTIANDQHLSALILRFFITTRKNFGWDIEMILRARVRVILLKEFLVRNFADIKITIIEVIVKWKLL